MLFFAVFFLILSFFFSGSVAALSLYVRFHYGFIVRVQWLAERILAEGHALALSETSTSCKYSSNNEIFG